MQFDFGSLIQLVAPALASALAGIYLWVARKKLGLQVSAEQERLIRNVVGSAVDVAEESARGALRKPTSDEKLLTARTVAGAELARLRLPQLAHGALDAAIHAALGAARRKP